MPSQETDNASSVAAPSSTTATATATNNTKQASSASHETKPYRQGVVIVLRNERSEVLVGRRADSKTWQFPQGGIDPGEQPRDTVFREAKEETGAEGFTIVAQAPETTRYELEPKSNGALSKRYRGQEHRWFLCELRDGEATHGPDLARALDDEFEALEWVTPQWALDNIAPRKAGAYSSGLAQLGLL